MAKQDLSLMSRLIPTNLKEEKEKFFFDSLYNPQFEYIETIDEDLFFRYGPVSHEYFNTAQGILNKVNHQWGDEEAYNTDIQGEILSQSEVEEHIKKYLIDNKLDDIISYSFSNAYVARTSVYQNVIQIRTPVQYRANAIESVLDHEVGTHIFRRLNDVKQPWHKKYTAFGFQPYLSTEEGMAVIHSQLSLPDRLLLYPALNYYAVCRAEQMSFSELFADLKKFVNDREKRFSLCLKVKRGITDTSVPGAFSKNQVYLAGTVRVAQWLVKNDFDIEKLYVGKIDIDDINKAWTQSVLSLNDLLIPDFAKKKKQYRETVTDIIRSNKLPIKLPKELNS